MTLLLPSMQEKFRTASDIFQDEALPLYDRGISPDDPLIRSIAIKAVSTILPELNTIFFGRSLPITVDSSLAVSVCMDDAFPYLSHQDAHTSGTLKHIDSEQITIERGFSDPVTGIDICLYVDPRYTNPDPVDIVFGETLCVPFSQINDVTIET